MHNRPEKARALVAIVLLSLAGTAMACSVETTTAVASNMKAGYAFAGLPAMVADPVTLTEVRSVIGRICTSALHPPWPATIGSCGTVPLRMTPASTGNSYPPIPIFRVTDRVDVPNSNTVAHAQAFLRAGIPANPATRTGIRWSW